MASWRRAWKRNTPVKPFQDTEWVERRREVLAESMSDLTMASDEDATEKYLSIVALWMMDHVDVLEEAEEITSEQAAEIRQAMRSQ